MFVCACVTSTVSLRLRTRLTVASANYSTVLFTVCVLHWATAIDRQERPTKSGSQRPVYMSESRGGLNSANDGKGETYLELDERYVAKLTTVIEANRDTADLEMLDSGAIGVKTQHVLEVETETYDVDCESGKCRESQDTIVKPSSL
jgi:hypothetical protein